MLLPKQHDTIGKAIIHYNVINLPAGSQVVIRKLLPFKDGRRVIRIKEVVKRNELEYILNSLK